MALLTQEWTVWPNTYSVLVVIEKDESGGMFVWVPRLPGCVSQGESIDECLANIRDAISGCLASYLAVGDIPWSQERFVRPVFSEIRDILVTVKP